MSTFLFFCGSEPELGDGWDLVGRLKALVIRQRLFALGEIRPAVVISLTLFGTSAGRRFLYRNIYKARKGIVHQMNVCAPPFLLLAILCQDT